MSAPPYSDKRHKTKFYPDKKRRFYKNDDSGSDGEGDSPFPGFPFPGLGSLKQKPKKEVFREHNHIYFRCDVTMEKVNQLCNLIEEYNREHDAIKSENTTIITIPKPIYLHITSMGGNMMAGFLAFDYIKNSKIPIYTVAEAYTVSSGANMFMAGHRRFMTENSYILVHQLNITKHGPETFHDIMDESSNVIEFMTRLYAMYLNNLRYNRKDVDVKDILTKEKLENHILHDIYWNYETCIRYGIVDGLYTNYVDNDMLDMHYYIDSDHETYHRPTLYKLSDLKPSEQMVNKIKELVDNKKAHENMIHIIQKHLANKNSTDHKGTGILNDSHYIEELEKADVDEEDEIKSNQTNKKRRRQKAM
jgi:ATP-dependent Clp protease protease subunit